MTVAQQLPVFNRAWIGGDSDDDNDSKAGNTRDEELKVESCVQQATPVVAVRHNWATVSSSNCSNRSSIATAGNKKELNSVLHRATSSRVSY